MDKVCFTQYIPSNKCEIKGYDQISQNKPVQNSIQTVKPKQNSDKPSSNNNKTLNWTIGLGAAATLIAFGVIAGRKGHLGDSIQEFLGGAKKTIGESTSDSKPSKHLPEETPARPSEEPPVNPPEGQPTNPPEGQPASATEGQPASAPEGQPASTNGEPPKILSEDENSEVHIEKPDKSLVPSGKNSQISDEQPELQIETQQPVEKELPVKTPIADESADTSTQNINGSLSDESVNLSEQSSADVDITPSPQPQQTSPRKPDAIPPKSDKPPVKPASAEPKKETALDKVKRFFNDPFGRKAKAKAEMERQKQEAAEAAEKKRLLAIKEQKAMEERIKLYPNMGIKQLEEHYAAHENFKEREIIYKLIQKNRFEMQAKMNEEYSKMGIPQLLEELEKLQVVKAGDRDYDAVVLVKNQLENKGYVIDDKLFEGHLPLTFVPYGEVGDNVFNFVNKRSSDYQGLTSTPDFLIPDFVRVSSYGLSTAIPGFDSPYKSHKFGRMLCVKNPFYQFEWNPNKSGTWSCEHLILNGSKDHGVKGDYYATALSYTNRKESGLARPDGSFAFIIPGDLNAETLNKIRNYFIKSGIVEEEEFKNLSNLDRQKIVDKMIEAVLDIVNK